MSKTFYSEVLCDSQNNQISKIFQGIFAVQILVSTYFLSKHDYLYEHIQVCYSRSGSQISCETYGYYEVNALNDFRLGNHVCDIYLHIKKVKIWNGLWHTKIGWNAYFMAHESFLSSSSFSLFSFRFLYFSPSFYLTTF